MQSFNEFALMDLQLWTSAEVQAFFQRTERDAELELQTASERCIRDS